MSAESPRKSNRQGGHIVAPQPVSDRSIIESVAGFINEVVPQAYTSSPLGENKEAITWARFEYADINDPALYPDSSDDRNGTAPLLLVLGYGSGVQVWAIPASGEATEVLSWRQGVVRTLRILPTPSSDSPVSDTFAHKRPLVALCDCAGGPTPQFCSLSFISLRGGDQVKSIKFKNPVSDVLANKRSVVVTFPERIAVFDASTLEDRLTVTTCYPCPGPNPNPVALGTRWLAYAERRLLPAKRSSGGSEGEGIQSYTATVLHAAKSFGKGLRELGETVASSLTGGSGGMGMQRVGSAGGAMVVQPGGVSLGGGPDVIQAGIVTIIDAEGTQSNCGEESRSETQMSSDNVIAHFTAHSEPIVALAFDPSGMLLLTADKRGHDFHVFRTHPHPGGSSLAAVHHLYVLHRGDTTAKVQDIAFAADSRWVAVSTLRGTTHVFPITPYGGPVGIRTHATPHVVNRLSRFHRSAGLTADGRNSPVPATVSDPVSAPPSMPYPNPRLPPYPHPTIISPLAQIRQPLTHALLSASTPTSPNPASQQAYHRNPSMRTLGRTHSSSEDGLPGGGIPLRVAACFAPPRAWLIGSPTIPRETCKAHKRAVDSLFVMACHGNLIEYDLEPKHAAGIPKEKVCDDTPIELEVQAKAQWMLLRPPHSCELQPPLPSSNPLMVLPDRMPNSMHCDSRQDDSDSDERWLSQVEIVTHAGPHRRLWMGPQFTFKTYNASVTGVPLSLLEMEAVEVGVSSGSRPARSNPVNMPLSSGARPVVPVLIESGSGSSYEQSPRLLEAYGTDGADSDGSAGPGETQLREDLADAMMESPGIPIRDTGRRVIVEMQHGVQLGRKMGIPIEKVVNPVGTVITVSYPVEDEEEEEKEVAASAAQHSSECRSFAENKLEDGNLANKPTTSRYKGAKPFDSHMGKNIESRSLETSAKKEAIGFEEKALDTGIVLPAEVKHALDSLDSNTSINSNFTGINHLLDSDTHVGSERQMKCENRVAEIRSKKKGRGGNVDFKTATKTKDDSENLRGIVTISEERKEDVAKKVPGERYSGKKLIPQAHSFQEAHEPKLRKLEDSEKCKSDFKLISLKKDLGKEIPVININRSLSSLNNCTNNMKEEAEGKKHKSERSNKHSLSPKDTEISSSKQKEKQSENRANLRDDLLVCSNPKVEQEQEKLNLESLSESSASCFHQTKQKGTRVAILAEGLQNPSAGKTETSPGYADLFGDMSLTKKIKSKHKREAIEAVLNRHTTESEDCTKPKNRTCLSSEVKEFTLMDSEISQEISNSSHNIQVESDPVEFSYIAEPFVQGKYNEDHFGNMLVEVDEFDAASSHKPHKLLFRRDLVDFPSLSNKSKSTSNERESISELSCSEVVAKEESDISETGKGSQDSAAFKSSTDDIYATPVRSWSSIVSSGSKNTQEKSKDVLIKKKTVAEIEVNSPDLKDAKMSPSISCQADESYEKNKNEADLLEMPPLTTVFSKAESSSSSTSISVIPAEDEVLAKTMATDEEGSDRVEDSNGNEEEAAEGGDAAAISSSQVTSKRNRRAKKKRR